ncbi:MAG: DUF1071 domain-containing protein, partial [Methanosarcinales archaeon]|nr:DUF1071 domain-containing protein [Methanosarcinales archaeon]
MTEVDELTTKSYFDILNAIDVSGKTETKGEGRKLTYLSWAYAWGELKK